MSWFERVCRRSGLMVHHVSKAVKQTADTDRGRARELRRESHEHSPKPGVTLRRTTIEEVEFRDDATPDSNNHRGGSDRSGA